MTSDTSPVSEIVSDISPSSAEDSLPQVHLKPEGERIMLFLPPKPTDPDAGSDWDEIWQQFKHRLSAGDRFWQPDTTVHLVARDRLLDNRQLHAIAEALSNVNLRLKRVYTSRRQTAVAAATAGYSVEQQSSVAKLIQQSATSEQRRPMQAPLYLQTTIRSGVEIQHPGTVVVYGDVNPGGSIVADGDILVWGRLRGNVYAGAQDDDRCLIMALHMEPTQIRIGNSVARGPDSPPLGDAEVAYVAADGIRIARAADFVRPEDR